MNKFLKSWVAPIIVAGIGFLLVRPVVAQVIGREDRLREYLMVSDLDVGLETVDGYQQVYYVFEGSKEFLTEGNRNNRQLSSAGEYLAWVTDINGEGQIFLHHVPTQVTSQLTNFSTNLNPMVDSRGRVVWEGWVEDTWQIFLFDGVSVTQLTEGETSVNPYIEGDYIVFGRRDISGVWRGVVHSISQKGQKDISVGQEMKNLTIQDGKIIMPGFKVFPLTIDDLFLLDLPPLTPDEPQTVTEEEIIVELEE
jgi:hypothetical protein